jgi:isopentenyl phosphate kinase
VKRSEIVVVKLGGSAITDKVRLETLRADNLAATCRQIKEVYQDVGSRVIVVHGAGSFGHHQAKQFSLKTGGDDATWLSGLTQTRASVLRLNTKVSEGLAEAGVPVASASPFSFMQMSDGCILKNSFVDHIVNLLAVGIVPISHGDVVLDKKRKCGILSGDRIMDLCVAMTPYCWLAS